jgi:hypothetical protein
MIVLILVQQYGPLLVNVKSNRFQLKHQHVDAFSSVPPRVYLAPSLCISVGYYGLPCRVPFLLVEDALCLALCFLVNATRMRRALFVIGCSKSAGKSFLELVNPVH